MRILDIDLDFFLNKKHFGNADGTMRLPEEEYNPWTREAFIEFLENKCGLNLDRKICGRVFTHHDEVFYYLRELQENNNFELTFDIDHLDAHGDIGHGDASHLYISSELLHLPVEDRCYPIIGGMQGLGAGNYLSFAIACRWLSSLNYITRPKWNKDIAWFHFRSFDISTNIIEMKKYTLEQLEEFKIFCLPEHMIKFNPVEIEPEVPFLFIDSSTFESDGNYDFVFLTQSPGFTPESSDELIPVFERYIINCD
jgi:hypothetical protein